MSDVEPRLLTAPEAARYLNLSESHVRQMVFERRVPYVKIGRSLRFDRADLDQWIEGNKTEAAS